MIFQPSRLASLLATFGLCLVPAFSQDECTGAVGLSDGPNGPFSTVGMTTSPSPWPCGLAANDMWFAYTAACSGTATVDACAATFDTVLQAFSGTCNALSSLACNDDDCAFQSRVSFAVVAGGTYFIRVGGFMGATGSVSLTVACTPGAPTNDECAAALDLRVGANGPFTGVLATPSSPAWSCGISSLPDVWFRFMAPCSADFTFETCGGAGFDTVMELFQGSCSSLAPLACNDDACGSQSSITASLTRGSTVYLRVGGFPAGSFDLTISANSTVANDECAGAIDLSVGTNGPFDNTGATTSTPFPCNPLAGCDVWFKYTSGCTDELVIGTCSLVGLDTTVQIFEGSCGSLTPLRCNDDVCALQSVVTIPATSGTTYFIRVGGFGGSSAPFEITVSHSGAVGGFSNVATGCGSVTLSGTGEATPGGELTYTLTSASGSPFMWFGFEVGPIPLCPPEPCALGADFGFNVSGTSVTVQVPCDLAIVGASIATQGADLELVQGACPPGLPFNVSFSDTIVTTFQ